MKIKSSFFFLLVLFSCGSSEEEINSKTSRIKIGMNYKQVNEFLGAPNHINTFLEGYKTPHFEASYDVNDFSGYYYRVKFDTDSLVMWKGW